MKDEAEIRAVIDAVRAEPNGELVAIDRRIARFETQYGFDSVEMTARVERGDLPATQEVEVWLMALRVRDELAAFDTRAR
ncbi:MAG TPA: hypothetical protein VHE35_29940 [Kofleriaceae bacterium]|nr:hypothetical protein [Kofleriaceae bacterium]